VSNVFNKYWDLRMRSATARLEAAKQLIEHNPTRGSTAENALRNLLREFLPQRCGIGGGFVLAANGKLSRQIDIIIFDQLEAAPLYRDGDVVIVSPDSTYVVVEVKSDLKAEKLEEAFDNINSVKALDPNVRGIVFGYASATAGTFAEHLPQARKNRAGLVPEHIICLERELVIIWDPQRAVYNCYEHDVDPTQQLVNEVLSAGKATRLQPYLPSLSLPSQPIFSV